MPISVRLNVKVPQQVFDSQAAVQRIVRTMQEKTAPALKELFGQSVEGWQNPPEWSQKQTVAQTYISMQVYASGENAKQYAIVNNGSPPHLITPRRAGYLRFRSGYIAGTVPKSLHSKAFIRYGPYVTVMNGVNHPGFEAREFDQTVADEHYDQFVQDMQDAMKP